MLPSLSMLSYTTLNFLSWAVPFCVMVLRMVIFVTRRKKSTPTELLVLPAAGFPRALIPGLSKEVLEEVWGKGS
jgi:hypothetical protein